MRSREIILTAIVGITALELSQTAFSLRSKKIIDARDGGKCVICGAVPIERAHISHKRDRRYDLPENGRDECAYHHYLDHFMRHGTSGLGLTKEQNIWSLEQILGRVDFGRISQLPDYRSLPKK